MDKKDSKIQLFLEFCHPKPIQILEIYPLIDSYEWTFQQMYSLPTEQSYYVWINDKSLLQEMQTPSNPNEDIERIKSDDSIRIEFNVNGIDDSNLNPEEEKEIILAKVNIENAKCIYDYSKFDKKKMKEDYSIPIYYSLKGRIKTLLFDEPETELKQELNINHSQDNKDAEDGKIDTETPVQNQQKQNSSQGIDGHWFLVNGLSRITLISFIRYKELTFTNTDNNEQSNIPGNKMTSSVGYSQYNHLQPYYQYYQPMQYAIYTKENNKLVSLYQSKSCKYHSKKNEFFCKDCNDYCCLECFDENETGRSHKGHKIKLLDEVLGKMDEDSKALDERVASLKNIINDEMAAKRNELVKIKSINAEMVKRISDLNEKKKMMIKLEEIRRAKALAALSSELLRIISDFHQKEKYLKLLAQKGDMATYLSNYFIFTKFFKNDVKKNLAILENKIMEIYHKFVESNQNWQNNMNSMK